MGDNFTQAFDLIIDKVYESLSKRNFKKEILKPYENVEFKDNNISYVIFFDSNNKIFELRLHKIVENTREESYISISKWLFDEESDTMKEADQIANDFCSSIQPEEKKPRIREIRKKDKDDNIDILFFMNRIINIFPELKEKLQEEKSNYEVFRSVTFTKENINSVIDKFLSNNPDKARLKKLGNVLSDMYNNGNVDVRGLITIVILNSIKEEYVDLIKENISEELANMWKEANKIKGKDIKPEKIKKRKSFITDTLAQM